MAKPIITKITPFDATNAYTVSLLWTGNRPKSNRIIITDNITGSTIFDDIVTTYALQHIIPAGKLVNGRYYMIQAIITDEDGNVSALSDKKLFYTLTTPTFMFNNLPEDKLKNASYAASITYYSVDLEELQSYKFYLYDSVKIKILESDMLTDTVNVGYTYKALQNNTSYYVQCIGYTKNGLILDTGLHLLNVYYDNPSIYSRVYAENMPDVGCVTIKSHFIHIKASGDDNYEYIDDYIDLTSKKLIYNQGFKIEGDFAMKLTGKKLWKSSEILRMRNDYNNVVVSSYIYPDNMLRFKLTVDNGLCNYILYSDALSFEQVDDVTIFIKRVNNIYLIKTFIQIGNNSGEEKSNIWYGLQYPSSAQNLDIWIDDDGTLYKVDKDSYSISDDSTQPSSINKDDLWIGGE